MRILETNLSMRNGPRLGAGCRTSWGAGMQLVVLVLNREEMLEDVLSGYVELGISGATVIDSVGMMSLVARQIPIFAGLRGMLEGKRPYNKTIMCVVKDDKAVDNLVALLEEILGDLDDPANGMMFTVPLSRAWGVSFD